MILHRYIALRFLKVFAGVFTVFFLMMLMLDLVEQLNKFSSSEASLAVLFGLALLHVPREIYEIFPLIMVISSVTLFLGLSRSSEMVVTRAAGRAAVRALLGPLVMAFMIGVLSLVVMNPIVAATSREYEARANSLRGEDRVLAFGSNGLWLRQGDAVSQTVIRADAANLDGTVLQNVTFLTLATDGLPTQRVAADMATLTDGQWTLAAAKIWPLVGAGPAEAAAQTVASFAIPSTLTADQIRNSFGTPSSIPIYDLPAFINRLQTAGFSAQRYLVWFQTEIASPVFLVAMVLIGASFTLRHQRGQRTGVMVLLAIMFSFGAYFIANFAAILGENGQLPAPLAAWVPPLAAIGLSLGFLLQKEDG